MANKNHLKVGKFDLVKLAKKFGTPLYVYDGNKILENYKKICASIPYNPKQIHYAVMCNNRKEILRILLKSESFLQVNSLKEYNLAKKVGFSNKKISVTTTNINKKELAEFIKEGAQLNLDSVEEIEKYGQLIEQFRQKKIRVNNKIGIRVFVHVKATGRYITNKPYEPKARVGIKQEKFEQVKKLAKKYKIKVIGVHGYLASNMIDLAPFLKLNEYLIKCAEHFKDIEYINFGAGFGLSFKDSNKEFDWLAYGKEVSLLMQSVSKFFGREINLKIEPGRSIVGEAGILLTQVTNIKNMDYWKEVGVDCGFGVFARPYIYGWQEGGYHQVVVANKMKKKSAELYTICANSVLQEDYLAEDRKLPKVELDDIIAFLGTGAYGAIMASLFPGMRRPGEVLIYNNDIKVIQPTEK